MNNNSIKKKILVTAYWYPPEMVPRAFRAHELVKEMSQRGYYIDLYIPKQSYKNIADYEMPENINYHYVDSIESKRISRKDKQQYDKNKRNAVIKSYTLLKRLSKSGIRLFLGGNPKHFYYGVKLLKKLLKDSLNCQYDMIISIGLPFYVHLATARYINKTKQKGSCVCDYGDPFFYSPAHKKLFFYKFIEYWSIKHFDYITIPIEESKKYYLNFKDEKSIIVIPQGFDFKNNKLEAYVENAKPLFCYSGIFYKTIRNPEFFLQHLCTIEQDFQFIIYTRLNDIFFNEVYSKYQKKLKNKVILREFIKRKELIRELSKMDFLINFENSNTGQSPSKVIDYALSGRPILSIKKDSFNRDTFKDFLSGNYSKALKVDIEKYEIGRVVDMFIKLMKNKENK